MHRKTHWITSLWGAIAVSCAVSLAACGDTPSAPEPVRTPNTLSGTVSEMSGNRPLGLEGAVVTHVATGQSVRTDRSGAYFISELPAGMTTVTVAKDGYDPVTTSVGVFGDARLNLQLVRRREPLPPAALSGVVYETTAAGRVPVAGVHVEDSNTHISSTTDAEGRYRLVFEGIDRSLFDGSVSLYVAKQGYQTISRLEMGVSGDTLLDIEIVRR